MGGSRSGDRWRGGRWRGGRRRLIDLLDFDHRPPTTRAGSAVAPWVASPRPRHRPPAASLGTAPRLGA
eukprot:5966542-Prymnesium_polylepis.1